MAAGHVTEIIWNYVTYLKIVYGFIYSPRSHAETTYTTDRAAAGLVTKKWNKLQLNPFSLSLDSRTLFSADYSLWAWTTQKRQEA